ncbi:hypothetical protein FACS189432_03670 [Bacteroidia bacterium]|nr:hypothetical protein FACS189426_21160 [Bacteroidia bacterium]GHT27341.1 hypothetical protein FACS189432_03670 [Bacteroidia bacterium]
MNILFLPNWTVYERDEDDITLQSTDKYVSGEKYWFFKYFPEDTQVDVIDIQARNILHWIEKKMRFYIWQSVLAFKKRRQYDVVISHGAQSGLMYALLCTLFDRKGPKHIIFDIGGMNGGKSLKIENSLINFALKSKPYIICHSKIIIENYRKTFQELIPRTRFIPFGINPEEFAPSLSIVEENHVFSFGYLSRDYKTLMKAWENIPNTSMKLRIAGFFPLDKVADNVEYIGKISIDRLKKEIQASKFVVLPMPVYNFSYGQMSFLQSMCLGKTIIVTRTPGSVDYIQDGNGAFFVEPYNASDLKNKIEMLLSDEDLLRANNRKASLFVTEHFTEEKMAKNIYKYIETILHDNAQ